VRRLGLFGLRRIFILICGGVGVHQLIHLAVRMYRATRGTHNTQMRGMQRDPWQTTCNMGARSINVHALHPKRTRTRANSRTMYIQNTQARAHTHAEQG
jgi:hypothetical protein